MNPDSDPGAPGHRGRAQDVGQESRRDLLVGGRDDQMVDLDGHRVLHSDGYVR